MTTFLSVFSLFSCGGGSSSSSPPPPAQDFTISVSSPTLSADVGTSTPPATVTVTAVNGFAGSVSVQLQGVPAGVQANPATFTLAAGGHQDITFSLSTSAPVGTTVVTLNGRSGALFHSVVVNLIGNALVKTYTSADGKMLFLESGNDVDTARVGLYLDWGGSIIEVSVNGTNYVNWHDTGREVQPAFRTSSDVNWNPTLGGDGYDRGTPVIDQVVNPDSLYIKAQPLQWSPDFYGGGATQTVLGDMLVEQTVTAVTNFPHTFKVHYKSTHLGSDLHLTAGQEFPAVYTNRDYIRFVYYGGMAPWTSGAVTVMQWPNLGAQNSGPPLSIPERWGALVNQQNLGLTVYGPSGGPIFIGFVSPDVGGGGPTDNFTNYFAEMWNWTITPNVVREADVYLIGGDYTVARSIIYELHKTIQAPDISAPFVNVDAPAPGAPLSGSVSVAGWAFDDQQVSSIEILVDGSLDGMASYGQPRPDVAEAYPGLSPVNVGFNYSLSTNKYANGPHTLTVRATDSSGNVAIARDVPVTIAN